MSLDEAEIKDVSLKGFSVVNQDKCYILRFEDPNDKTNWHNAIIEALSKSKFIIPRLIFQNLLNTQQEA